ncbi:glycosyltransferase [Actinoplanes sp. TRM 88003]|uniref:Glycosyltransferase n=1 Tax=Paractinoplanes aksuensis TaxID=2939490 RepID=A0ABT1DQI5_9ACTN|nr:glycosyltransferase [Actinoplanes aksuensis]MCO8273099.1 glycosyltransferase [Actinoplanes aksuensis]
MIPVRDPAGLHLMLRGMPPVDEIVVVDVEGDLPELPGAILVRPGSTGAGSALAAGVGAARGDVVVTLNGDGSTDPAEIPRFVAALVDGADVALGSRYAAGGRDLTGGRFRRWADRLLIWFLNALLGLRRTDPGFGYAAFWRDTVADLGLPGRRSAPTVWGAGPEIGPVLALRPARRGLRVAEVASVAYPPVRRTLRADRARLHHWVRTALRERGRPAGPVSRPAVDEQRTRAYVMPNDRMRRTNETGAGRRALDRRAVEALAAGRRTSERLAEERWEQADRREVRPLWATPGRRTAAPHHLANGAPPVWRDGHPERLGGPDTQPRPGPAPWPADGPTQPTPRPEVGSRRRRIAGARQSQPDLRVINGEGAGPTTGRRARLRSVKKP